MKSFTVNVLGADYQVSPAATTTGTMQYTVKIVFVQNPQGDILPIQQIGQAELLVKIGEAIQAHFS